MHYSLKLIRANDKGCTVMRCNSKINCSKQFFRHVIILAPIVLFVLELFGCRRDVPAKIWDFPPKKFDFPGFEGHTELFGPHPFTWKTPTPPENIRTQKFRFLLFFSCLKIVLWAFWQQIFVPTEVHVAKVRVTWPQFQSNLSGDTFSIEAPQNLLRTKGIF